MRGTQRLDPPAPGDPTLGTLLPSGGDGAQQVSVDEEQSAHVPVESVILLPQGPDTLPERGSSDGLDEDDDDFTELHPLIRLGEALDVVLNGTDKAATASCRAMTGAMIALAELATDFQETLYSSMQHVFDLTLKAARFIPLLFTQSALVHRFTNESLRQVTPAILVLIIMGTLYFVYGVCCLHLNGIPSWSVESITFHVVYTLAMIAYYQTIVTDPGGIPEGFDPNHQALAERKRTSGELRFCKKEKKFKPDRAHYCSNEKRNVLRMDHYCPWMSTCIGYRNHKYFILFLLYSSISTNVVTVALIKALVYNVFPPGATIVMIEGAVLTTVISFLLTPFFCFHLWMLSLNLTTIEYCERKRDVQAPTSPYDIGLIGNFRCVLGDNIMLWLLPIGAPHEGGLFWQRRDNASDVLA